ncbi:MAG: DEAD/DEAH box helicase family protein [Armatimonadetes bacterium]|nr:DEAD/DEAH box helicase family protein [Armatimonadota bacterium]
MTQERFEWLDIPKETSGASLAKALKGQPAASIAKRCPRCGWLETEDATECFRCGYQYGESHYAEALRQMGVALPPRETRVDPGFRQVLARREADPPGFYELRLRAEELLTVRGFERLLCLDLVDVIHYPHQLQTALTALQKMRARVLLCDEVGLGKTIEAGIIMKELIVRGLARKILVLVPASLTGQWQEEMLAKFGEAFEILTSKTPHWERHDRVIASLDTAKQEANARVIHELEYDLLIIDEAHKLKDRATQVYKFVSRVAKKYVLMLTATPVHNNLRELYNMITILKPGLLGTTRSFSRQFVGADPRQPRNVRQLRTLLSEVMIRNRRASVGIQFPGRRAAVYHLELTPPERELYNAVEHYIREEFTRETRSQQRVLSLVTLQKELCSSPQAVAETLRRMSEREHYPEVTRRRLRAFHELAREISDHRKARALIELLERFPGKLLVFTDFLPTLRHLQERLREAGHAVEVFHGSLTREEREAALLRFRGASRVMVSTHSGGEGHNLQFCHMLVNYDLPWNPMKVEQRIGRLHRLGQENDVSIFNFSTNDTVEESVLEILAQKIRMFELVIGETDMILGLANMRKSFEELIAELWLGSRDRDEARRRLEGAGDQFLAARERYGRAREAAELLSDVQEG